MLTRSASTALLLVLLGSSSAVDHAKFRTCQQTGFCRRHRGSELPHPYVVAPGSLALDSSGAVTGRLHGGPFGVSLTLRLVAYTCGASRLRITETNPLHGPRWEPTDILEAGLQHTPLHAVDVFAIGTAHAVHGAVASGEMAVYGFGTDGALVAISYHPFKAALYLNGARVVALNPNGRFYFEHHRKRDDHAKPLAAPGANVHAGKTVVDYGEDGLAVYSDGTKQQRAEDAEAAGGGAGAATEGDTLWEESFGSHRDSKPFGPASVGMDVTFDGSSHLYGLAEHAAPLNLPSTTGSAAKYSVPYRMCAARPPAAPLFFYGSRSAASFVARQVHARRVRLRARLADGSVWRRSASVRALRKGHRRLALVQPDRDLCRRHTHGWRWTLHVGGGNECILYV